MTRAVGSRPVAAVAASAGLAWAGLDRCVPGRRSRGRRAGPGGPVRRGPGPRASTSAADPRATRPSSWSCRCAEPARAADPPGRLSPTRSPPCWPWSTSTGSSPTTAAQAALVALHRGKAEYRLSRMDEAEASWDEAHPAGPEGPRGRLVPPGALLSPGPARRRPTARAEAARGRARPRATACSCSWSSSGRTPSPWTPARSSSGSSRWCARIPTTCTRASRWASSWSAPVRSTGGSSVLRGAVRGHPRAPTPGTPG